MSNDGFPSEQDRPATEKQVIATVIGDPAGIGPEVCVKALADSQAQMQSRVVLIGAVEALHAAMKVCRLGLELHRIDRVDDETFREGSIAVLDPGKLQADDIRVGNASAACGRAAFEWVAIANALCREHRIHGYVMGPLNEESLRLAGHSLNDPELEPPGTFQLRVSGPLRAVPLTEHLPIREIASTVRKDRVLHLLRLLDSALNRWGLAQPRIAVAGLNPHAMFEEDRQEIAPAVIAAKQLGIDAIGPVSPDSVFREALEGRYDVIVTMYHDQGQIAVKTAAFAGACTIFLGLPYIRIGVPHGTAFDIAGTGQAQHLSMMAAMRTASALAAGRGFQSFSGETLA